MRATSAKGNRISGRKFDVGKHTCQVQVYPAGDARAEVGSLSVLVHYLGRADGDTAAGSTARGSVSMVAKLLPDGHGATTAWLRKSRSKALHVYAKGPITGITYDKLVKEKLTSTRSWTIWAHELAPWHMAVRGAPRARRPRATRHCSKSRRGPSRGGRPLQLSDCVLVVLFLVCSCFNGGLLLFTLAAAVTQSDSVSRCDGVTLSRESVSRSQRFLF